MSAQLPDDTSGAAHPPSRPATIRRTTPEEFLRRNLTRIAWRADPVARLQHLPDDDALIVEFLPLPPVADRLVDDLLCIEFDGDDSEALPTSLCLTGFAARPGSTAARCAEQVLGKTLWAIAQDLVRSGDGERTVELDDSVRDSRLRNWRRLTGLGIGVDVQPGILRATLVDPDGDAVAVRNLVLTGMDPDAVTAGIAEVVTALRAEQHVTICGSPVVLGVQIPGPVDAASGVVHYFSKRSRSGERTWGWDDEPLAERLHDVLDLPVQVINDVVGYATYERWFHPTTDRCRAVLLIDQGIGAKLVVDGRIDQLMPMEIGNMVLREDGPESDSGQRGCLEATAGTLAIVEQISWLTGIFVTDIGHAVRVAQPDGGATDEQVLDVFREAGRDLAHAIGNVQAIANPDSWVVYGPEQMLAKGSAAGAAFLHNLLTYKRFVAHKPYQQCVVYSRPIIDDEGPRGAALAALERFGHARPERSTTDSAAAESDGPAAAERADSPFATNSQQITANR